MSSAQHRGDKKDESADEPHPVETHQGIADDQPGGMNANSRSGKERRQSAERDGGQDGSKENQRAQPNSKRQVDRRMEGGSHLGLHGSPAGEPLNATGHRRVSGKEIGEAGATDKGGDDKQVQLLGIGVELL